jgi:DNA-binding transcriptional MerR regulator
MGLKIGELARATRATPPTIRYYEEIGLLPRPSRTGGQRRYARDAVRRLIFIRRCREFGFSIAQVRTLASLAQDSERPCAEARSLAEARLAAVREQLVELHVLERGLAELIDAGDALCPGGAAADCAVLEHLSQP